MRLFLRRMFLTYLLIICFSLLQIYPAFAQDVSTANLDESTSIVKIVDISKQLQAPGLRGQHPKGHGVVWAELTVAPDLPESLQIGVFKEPGKTFPAWIRFSNARVADDTQPGMHGMAIKLMGVEGEKVLEDESSATTQDFVLGDHPVFFIRNAQDFAHFFEVLAQAPNKLPLKFIFPGANPLKWHIHEAMIMKDLQSIKIANLLAVEYWSQTPYQFGPDVIKFAVKPTSQIGGTIGKTPDYLRSAMVDYLKKNDATFDFLIQQQANPDKMPIDDPTIKWNEKDAPFQKVATIRIPRQVFDTPEQLKFGENLSFTPWHSLPEHQPLGSINLARKAIYRSLSEVRHEQTGLLDQEPMPETFAPQLLN